MGCQSDGALTAPGLLKADYAETPFIFLSTPAS
jgi:hypothetical protein